MLASLDPKPTQATWSQLMGTIAHRLTPQPVKLRADVELTCFTEAGIEAIKRALLAGEACGSDEVPIKARLVAPPLYVLGTNATNKVGPPFCFGNGSWSCVFEVTESLARMLPWTVWIAQLR